MPRGPTKRPAPRPSSVGTVRFFPTPERWRAWLEKHHASAAELWVGFYKKGTGKRSITWPEAVDEALCYGWIDGIRKSIDETSYTNRFTPRRKGSNWSEVNIARIAELTQQGRMAPAGLAAFEARDPRKSGSYSFEQRQAPTLGDDFERRFRSNRKAWAFFEAQPPGYRRLAIFWGVSAKREETRERRLATLIADSAAGQRIGDSRKPGER